VLFHDTYSSTVDVVYQFIPVLKANGYHLVTVSHLLGARAPGSNYGGRDNGPPANDIHDIPPGEVPDAAEHAVAEADAEPPDHRHSGPELGRPEQRGLAAPAPADEEPDRGRRAAHRQHPIAPALAVGLGQIEQRDQSQRGEAGTQSGLAGRRRHQSGRLSGQSPGGGGHRHRSSCGLLIQTRAA
jgi:hypothetical protein